MKRSILCFLCLLALLAGCSDPAQLLPNAKMEYARGNFDEAIVLCSEAIQKDSTEYEAYILRGKSYMALRKYDDAIADFTSAIMTNPNRDAGYYERAFAYEKIGETEKAETDAERARQLDPKYQAFVRSLAQPLPSNLPGRRIENKEPSEDGLDEDIAVKDPLKNPDDVEGTDNSSTSDSERMRRLLGPSGMSPRAGSDALPGVAGSTPGLAPGSALSPSWPGTPSGPLTGTSPGGFTPPGIQVPAPTGGTSIPGLPKSFGMPNLKTGSAEEDNDPFAKKGEEGEGTDPQENEEPQTPGANRPVVTVPGFPQVPGPFGGVRPGPTTGIRSGGTMGTPAGPANPASPWAINPSTPQSGIGVPGLPSAGGGNVGGFYPRVPRATGIRSGQPSGATSPSYTPGPAMFGPAAPNYGTPGQNFSRGYFRPGGQFGGGVNPPLGGFPGAGVYGPRRAPGSVPGSTQQPVVPVNPYGTGNVMAPPRNQLNQQNRR